MKKIDNFVNLYPVSKTLRFRLIPQGKTEENFFKNKLLEEDEQRDKDYKVVKKLIDKYHKYFIDKVLSKVKIENINEYAQLYYVNDKSKEDKDKLLNLEAAMRKHIALAFHKDEGYKVLFSKELIEEILPEFVDGDENKKAVDSFKKFTTYFGGYHNNRKNMYSDEEKSTAIAYRCINENLHRYLDNAKSMIRVLNELSITDKNEIDDNFVGMLLLKKEDIVFPGNYNRFLSQKGINEYNELIGGYTICDGTKVKGINEYINQYNQVHDKSCRLPKLKPLYKQILSEEETVSFIPEGFNSDKEVIDAVNACYYLDGGLKETASRIKALFDDIEEYNSGGINVSANALTEISQRLFSSWDEIRERLYAKYDNEKGSKKQKNNEKYLEKREAEVKSIKSFSLQELQELCYEEEGIIVGIFLKQMVLEIIEKIEEAARNVDNLLKSNYPENKSLVKETSDIYLIKALLDSAKELERALKIIDTNSQTNDKDLAFYAEFTPCFDKIVQLNKIYDKVRNYVTKKPYSTDKIKLNFQNPQLLGGWDISKVRDYRSTLLRDGGVYYLAIIDKQNSDILETVEKSARNNYEKLNYKLLPGPNKMLPKVFFAKKNIEYYAPSEEIIGIKSKNSFKKGADFNIDDCHKLIDFYKDSIRKTKDWSTFNFKFRDTQHYDDISGFYKEVSNQGYKVKFDLVSKEAIDKLVVEGKLYLFQLYNKDFSEYSKGKKNLHTLYFESLFNNVDESAVAYKLSGGAEMFYRRASITEKDHNTVHKAKLPINNRHPRDGKEQSIFEYDIVKNRRYTKNQFYLHLPIEMNYNAVGINNINTLVRENLKECRDNYVIGIDRGERNLIYASVINSHGRIVEQKTFNIIGDVDYRELLKQREKERDQARKSWETIENIKELKGGYLSLVVHEIAQLVIKYDAIVAMENLNSGFKNSRKKFEKEVYQKFEKMLIDKLNYLVDKSLDPDEKGGLFNAYQLTNKFESFKKIGAQNGMIFYVPAWLTSKIDPSTGFVNLFKLHHKSKKETIEFISQFDKIAFDNDKGLLRFDFHYSKFNNGSIDYKDFWSIYSYGDRIKTFRNSAKNNEYDSERVDLTSEFRKLFNEYGIELSPNMQESILQCSNESFLRKFMNLFSLLVQMRNSISNSTNPKDDFMISPVINANGIFYDSREYSRESDLPCDADANGAYNIARKALWGIEQIKNSTSDNLNKTNLMISNKEWLKYAQMHA